MDIRYNLTDVSRLLSDFYTLTDFRIALFDKNFQELYSYPSRLSDFCKTIRENGALRERCILDDLYHLEQCKAEKRTVIYTCHAGLYEIITPVLVDEEVAGYIMAGQIYGDNCYLSNFDMICTHFKAFNLDVDKLSQEYQASRKTTLVKLEATKHFLEVCAQYLCASQSVSVDKSSLRYEIDSYILKNLATDLSIELLCKQFHYHKTTFCKVTKKLYGVPMMQHIRQLRIYKAKELLANTDLKINAVADAVGIFDYNYFTKVFKSEVKCTPREFRKNNMVRKR